MMNVQTSSRIPKIILKSLYESFRADDTATAQAKLSTVEGVDLQDGLALAELARSCATFQDFNAMINVDHVDPGTAERARHAAQMLATTAAAASKFPWQSTTPTTPTTKS